MCSILGIMSLRCAGRGLCQIVISWKYYTERLFDSSCVNHDSTQPQFPIYMYTRCIRNNDRPRCAIIWREYRSSSGRGRRKRKVLNIKYFPLSLSFPRHISLPLQNSVSSPCSAYKFPSPFACFSNMYRYEWQSLPYLVTSTPPEYIAYLEELFLDISLFAKFLESAVYVISNTILSRYAQYIFDEYV